MASTSEIWLVDFGDAYPEEPAQIRPGVVVGPPATYEGAPFVFVAPMTTARRGLGFHVEVEARPSTGLDATSYVQCEKSRSVSRRRLIHRLGTVGARERADISRTLRFLIDI